MLFSLPRRILAVIALSVCRTRLVAAVNFLALAIV